MIAPKCEGPFKIEEVLGPVLSRQKSKQGGKE